MDIETNKVEKEHYLIRQDNTIYQFVNKMVFFKDHVSAQINSGGVLLGTGQKLTAEVNLLNITDTSF